MLLCLVAIRQSFPVSSAAIIAMDRAHMTSTQNGIVTEVMVEVGQAVEPGATLVALSHPAVDTRERDLLIQQAEAHRQRRIAMQNDMDARRLERDTMQQTLVAQIQVQQAADERRQAAMQDALRMAQQRETEARTQLAGLHARSADSDTIAATETALQHARSDVLRIGRELERLAAADAATQDVAQNGVIAATLAPLQADIIRLEAALKELDAAIAEADAAVALAEADVIRRSRSVVTAARPGVVSAPLPTVGATAEVGQSLVIVDDPQSVHILAAVDRRNADRFVEGDKVLFRTVGSSERLSGTLIAVHADDDASDPSANNGFRHRFRHRLILRIQPDSLDGGSLKPGASVRVLFLGTEPGGLRSLLGDLVGRTKL